MAELKVTKMIWLIVLITAAYCVPLLERNDLRNFVNFRKSVIKELYEQQNRLHEGNIHRTGASLRTNNENGQVNKKNEVLKRIATYLIEEKTDVTYPNVEADDETPVASNADSLTQFKDILDGILERVGPSEKDLESIEKSFESKNDYNSVILDFMNLFDKGDTSKDTINDHGTFDDKNESHIDTHSNAEAAVRDKLAEAYLRKYLQKSGIGEVNNDKVKTFLQTFGIDLSSLKKQRTKRLTYDDGKIYCVSVKLKWIL